MPNEPRLEFLYTLTAELGAPTTIGDTPHGQRLIVPVNGGTFEGPRLKGKVLPGGGDWLLVRPDGVGNSTRELPYGWMMVRSSLRTIADISPGSHGCCLAGARAKRFRGGSTTSPRPRTTRRAHRSTPGYTRL